MQILKILGYLSLLFLLSGCISTGGSRIDNIPMYGQPEIERPEPLVQADKDFIHTVSTQFGSREEASKIWYAQGDKFLNQRNYDFAMRRYNQSWLLDPNNYQPYWGFARILMEKNNIDAAIKHLEKSESLIDDSYQEVALLSDMGIAYTIKGNFTKANDSFIKSTKIDPSYPNSWRRWAFSLFEQGKYKEALDKVNKAEALKANSFPADFIDELNKKLAMH